MGKIKGKINANLISTVGERFDEGQYCDIAPCPDKSAEELIILVLSDFAQVNQRTCKYSPSEIRQCARLLINSGLLRGTVINEDNVVWSKPSAKGLNYLKILKCNYISKKNDKDFK